MRSCDIAMTIGPVACALFIEHSDKFLRWSEHSGCGMSSRSSSSRTVMSFREAGYCAGWPGRDMCALSSCKLQFELVLVKIAYGHVPPRLWLVLEVYVLCLGRLGRFLRYRGHTGCSMRSANLKFANISIITRQLDFQLLLKEHRRFVAQSTRVTSIDSLQAAV